MPAQKRRTTKPNKARSSSGIITNLRNRLSHTTAERNLYMRRLQNMRAKLKKKKAA